MAHKTPPILDFHDDVLDSVYIRKDVFLMRCNQIDERCGVHSKLLEDLQHDAKADRKYTQKLVITTLTFVIVTLISILGAIGWGIFG